MVTRFIFQLLLHDTNTQMDSALFLNFKNMRINSRL